MAAKHLLLCGLQQYTISVVLKPSVMHTHLFFFVKACTKEHICVKCIDLSLLVYQCILYFSVCRTGS